MTRRQDIRRLAMQVLYQIDVRGSGEDGAIEEGLEVGPDKQPVQQEARTLAQAAWGGRAEADRLARELAPDWPTHRQPPVDRAIIRLAYYEMVSGRTPIGVAINEAVVLAKEYCAAESPAFINGVLDRMAKGLIEKEREAKGEAEAAADAEAGIGEGVAGDGVSGGTATEAETG